MGDKILTVYCQHGDERFGALISNELLKQGVDTYLGSPRAFIAGTRYIDTDLNRSYGLPKGSGYEAIRAREILEKSKSYDLVIDIHSSYATVGDVAIIPSTYTTEMLAVIAKLGFIKAAVMPRHIASQSLIGNVAQGISLEYGGNSSQDSESAQEIADIIAHLDTVSVPKNAQIELYFIKDLIPNTYRGVALKNYQYSPELDGYPFLVGETRYKTYAGFFADRTETVIIRGNHD